jgi:hypothetical protein
MAYGPQHAGRVESHVWRGAAQRARIKVKTRADRPPTARKYLLQIAKFMLR